jgi:[ribosomal protein S18]-alanine N-acetyltransferase
VANPPVEIRLARKTEVRDIAEMSRELIERGLKWSWRTPRILAMVEDPECVVLVARTRVELAGFAVMQFLDTTAHLNLLAVVPARRRGGTGSALLSWLEESARVAGLEQVVLEVRRNNEGAREFYRQHQFEEVALLRGYYQGREHAIRMVHQLIEPTLAENRPR